MVGTSSSTTASWPSNPADLAAILTISHGTNIKCHGYTKKETTCSSRISKDAVFKTSQLLQQIVDAGRLTEPVLRSLKELSLLVLCQRYHHQTQADETEARWLSVLNALVHPPDTASRAKGEGKKSSQCNPLDKGHGARQPDTASRRTNAFKPDIPSSSSPDITTSKGGRSLRSKAPVRPPSEAVITHTLIPYAKPLSTPDLNKAVLNILLKPLADKDTKYEIGYIYAFTLPSGHLASTPDRLPQTGGAKPVKIGYTRNLPEKRQAKIARECQYRQRPKRVFDVSTRYYPRVEMLVHALLQPRRCHEGLGCPGCNTAHKEWFVVTEAEARAAMQLWADFAAMIPYTEGGMLKDAWRCRLKAVDLRDPGCWEAFVLGAGKHKSVRVKVEEGKVDASSTNPRADRKPATTPVRTQVKIKLEPDHDERKPMPPAKGSRNSRTRKA